MMRVLWPHNFDPAIPVAGVFMYVSQQALADAGVSPELRYLGNLRNPIQLLRARKAIAREAMGADLLHCQFGSAASLACSSIRSCPKIVSLRGSDWTPAHSRRLIGKVHALLATRFTRLALPHFDAAICMSNRIASEVQSAYPRLSVHVAPDPVNLAVFKPIDKATARTSLGLPTSGPRYVVFGSAKSANQLKRRWLAESAIQYAQRQLPEVRLLVATGYPHNMMPTVLSAADVAICTSTSEGWPNFIKEALACNVPFVSTDVSDLAAIAAIEPSCRVVAPTAEALGEALLDALNSPPPRDLRRHVASMDMAMHAEQLIRLYRQLAR
jgi:teichuronic acid biosynthesis glycosyltransferase TuaC